MSGDLEIAADRIRGWRDNAVAFVHENFGIVPDPWQRKVLEVFPDPTQQRIAMKACKGPGKTALEAWCVLNFLSCYGEEGEHPKGAGTSITEDNIDDNLWPEIAKWMNRSEFLKSAFTWTKSRVFAKSHPETWFFSKRTWAKSADAQRQANTLAGFHGKFIFFVLDESGAIPRSIMATADAALSTVGGWKKIMQGGNPTNLEGPLYDACTTEKELWFVVEITGDPDDPDRSPRISVQWANEQIKKYGKDNPWVLVNVFGRFPPSSINTLLGPDEVEDAKHRYGHLAEHDFSWSQKRLGVDVARFGDDRTVLYPRQGLMTYMPVEMRNQRTNQIAARVMLAKERWGKSGDAHLIQTFVDDTGGWGHGVVDNLISSGHEVQAVQYHAPAIDPQYANRRAEMWMGMQAWFRRGGALSPDVPAELTAELTVPTYTFDAKGRFLIEDKDQIKARLQRSPDLADALALTFAIPDLPMMSIEERRRVARNQHNMQSDYDPLANDRDREEEAYR